MIVCPRIQKQLASPPGKCGQAPNGAVPTGQPTFSTRGRNRSAVIHLKSFQILAFPSGLGDLKPAGLSFRLWPALVPSQLPRRRHSQPRTFGMDIWHSINNLSSSSGLEVAQDTTPPRALDGCAQQREACWGQKRRRNLVKVHPQQLACPCERCSPPMCSKF